MSSGMQSAYNTEIWAQLVCGVAGGYTVPQGQDVMISVYNIHHSPAVWDDAEAFMPERFGLDKPPPTEQNTDFRSALYSFVAFVACT